MSVLALILARGGSKEIPGKNIVLVKGKPLISYCINAALNSNVNETWVSTDDKKIKEVALNYGAKVLDRPDQLAQDTSKSEDALLHFASQIDFDVLVFIQPTSPLLQAEDINKGLKLMQENGYDSVFSVFKEHWIPRWTEDCKPVNWDPLNRPRRQDVSANYVENGAFYITRKKNLIDSGIRYSGKIGFVEMPLYRSFQVDSRQDLELIGRLL